MVAAPSPRPPLPAPPRVRARRRASVSAAGFGLGSGSAPLEVLPADYEAFERLLGDIQDAWSNEDVARLHTLATPEMVSYFTGDLQKNRARNVVNKVSGTEAAAGRPRGAWREGDTVYASVAMRFALIDKTLERTTGRLVEGSEVPTEATEVWTFMRPRGSQLGTLGDPADLKPDPGIIRQGAVVGSAAP